MYLKQIDWLGVGWICLRLYTCSRCFRTC